MTAVEVLRALRERWWVLVAATVLAALAAYVYVKTAVGRAALALVGPDSGDRSTRLRELPGARKGAASARRAGAPARHHARGRSQPAHRPAAGAHARTDQGRARPGQRPDSHRLRRRRPAPRRTRRARDRRRLRAPAQRGRTGQAARGTGDSVDPRSAARRGPDLAIDRGSWCPRRRRSDCSRPAPSCSACCTWTTRSNRPKTCGATWTCRCWAACRGNAPRGQSLPPRVPTPATEGRKVYQEASS